MPLPLQGSRGEGAPGNAFPPAASIVGNAGFSLVTQLLTSAFTAEPTLFLARRLGADHYGIFASLSGCPPWSSCGGNTIRWHAAMVQGGIAAK